LECANQVRPLTAIFGLDGGGQFVFQLFAHFSLEIIVSFQG
jgi:hypothetical protein